MKHLNANTFIYFVFIIVFAGLPTEEAISDSSSRQEVPEASPCPMHCEDDPEAQTGRSTTEAVWVSLWIHPGFCHDADPVHNQEGERLQMVP